MPQPITLSSIAQLVAETHNRLHSLFTWAATIELTLRISTIEFAVYWRNTSGESFVARQRIELRDLETLFDYTANLLRQKYLQSMGGKG